MVVVVPEVQAEDHEQYWPSLFQVGSDLVALIGELTVHSVIIRSKELPSRIFKMRHYPTVPRPQIAARATSGTCLPG